MKATFTLLLTLFLAAQACSSTPEKKAQAKPAVQAQTAEQPEASAKAGLKVEAKPKVDYQALNKKLSDIPLTGFPGCRYILSEKEYQQWEDEALPIIKSILNEAGENAYIAIKGQANSVNKPCPDWYKVNNIKKQRGDFLKSKLVEAGIPPSRLKVVETPVNKLLVEDISGQNRRVRFELEEP